MAIKFTVRLKTKQLKKIAPKLQTQIKIPSFNISLIIEFYTAYNPSSRPRIFLIKENQYAITVIKGYTTF